MSVTWPLGSTLKRTATTARLEDGRVHFIGDQRVPGHLRNVVPASNPGAEVDALRVGEDLHSAGTRTGVHRQSARPRIAVALLPLAVHRVSAYPGGADRLDSAGPWRSWAWRGRPAGAALRAPATADCSAAAAWAAVWAVPAPACCGAWRRRRLLCLLLHLFHRLLVDERLVGRRLGSNLLLLHLAHRVGHLIESDLVLVLLDTVKIIDSRRLEEVPGNPGEAQEQNNVHQHSPQNAFAQPRPAPLVFERADHLQQFVGVVVYPARAAHRGRGPICRLIPRRGCWPRFKVARGESVQAQDRARDRGFLRRAVRCGLVSAGFLGSFTSAGASLVGIQCDGAVQNTRTLLPAPFSSPFCLFSHFGQSFAQAGRPVQWFLLN